MVINFFKPAVRGLLKSKITTFINLFGLSAGMTTAVFIFLWVQNEITVDNYQPDNIYRLSYSSNYGATSHTSERSTFPIYLAASKKYPK